MARSSTYNFYVTNQQKCDDHYKRLKNLKKQIKDEFKAEEVKYKDYISNNLLENKVRELLNN